MKDIHQLIVYTGAYHRLRRTLHSTFVSNHHYDSLTIMTQSVMFNAGNPVNIEQNASYRLLTMYFLDAD